MRILAVDDDNIQLTILRDVLATCNLSEVVTAESGREALKALDAASEPFDCFLLDIQMPNMTGIELCQKIRATPGYENTPIIMLTAMSDREHVDDAFIAGADDYLQKPFNLDLLAERVMCIGARDRKWSAVAKDKDEAAPLCDLIARFEGDQDWDGHDVPGLVSGSALFAYLNRLDANRLFMSSVFAVGVDVTGPVDSTRFAERLPEMLLQSAKAISATLSSGNFVMGYLGGGQFAVITRRGDPVYSPRLKAEIGDVLTKAIGAVAQFGFQQVNIKLGPVCSSDAFGATSAHDLIDRASALIRGEIAANSQGPATGPTDYLWQTA